MQVVVLGFEPRAWVCIRDAAPPSPVFSANIWQPPALCQSCSEGTEMSHIQFLPQNHCPKQRVAMSQGRRDRGLEEEGKPDSRVMGRGQEGLLGIRGLRKEWQVPRSPLDVRVGAGAWVLTLVPVCLSPMCLGAYVHIWRHNVTRYPRDPGEALKGARGVKWGPSIFRMSGALREHKGCGWS